MQTSQKYVNLPRKEKILIKKKSSEEDRQVNS
jgi:hypothetical protein